MLTLLFKESKDLGDTVSLLESVVNSRLASFFFFCKTSKFLNLCNAYQRDALFTIVCFYSFYFHLNFFFFTGFIKFYYHVY